MASYNPAMLKNEPYGADWKAAPDLTSFAADYSSGASSSGGAYGSSAASAGAGNGAGTSLFMAGQMIEHRADTIPI